MAQLKHQEILKGLIRLHILHHASKDEFYGQWMIYELARHGYKLSPGTLYPMLHSLERRRVRPRGRRGQPLCPQTLGFVFDVRTDFVLEIQQ